MTDRERCETEPCQDGLQCVETFTGKSFCVKECFSKTDCPAQENCILFPDGGAGVCLQSAGLTEACGELAKAIAADAEGATHLVTIEVEGLRNDGEARQVGLAVANSALVKTAIFGILRFSWTVFPDACLSYAWPMMILGAVHALVK